jgi:hypothetical protein
MKREEIDAQHLYPAHVFAAFIGCSPQALYQRLWRNPKRYDARKVPGERGWFIPGTTFLRYFAEQQQGQRVRTVRGREEDALARAEQLEAHANAVLVRLKVESQKSKD